MTKARIDPAVAAFFERSLRDTVFVPSLVVAELRYGLARLPRGRRREGLARDLDTFLAAGFADRILVFDDACATAYATVRATREAAGRPVGPLDALIGGMAVAHGATLATRNLADFDGCGVALVDPWAAA